MNIYTQIIQRKKWNIIKIITKKEAFMLRKKGFAGYVLNGHGSYKNYHVVESPKILIFLEKYRESTRVK